VTRPNRSEYRMADNLIRRSVVPLTTNKGVPAAALVVLVAKAKASPFTEPVSLITGYRLVPIWAIDFYRGVAALPLLHNQER